MVTIIEELEAFIKEREAAYRDALAEARKVILEGLQVLQQEFPQLVPTPMCNICQHRGSTPPRTKAVTGHMPPTTTNARQCVPPPPPSRRHSHTQGVVHKRATQSSQRRTPRHQSHHNHAQPCPLQRKVPAPPQATSPKGPKALAPLWCARRRHSLSAGLWSNTDAMVGRCTAPHHVHGACAPVY